MTRSSSKLDSTKKMFRGAAILVLALVLLGCGRYPQVIEDEAVYKELDALYTAVTSRRRDLLEACRGRIEALHASGRLSDAGFSETRRIMTQADKDDWKGSAENLHKFMRAQRKNKRS